MYHVAQPCKYKKIEYKVGDELIPPEYLKLKSPDKLKDKMYTILNKDEIIGELLKINREKGGDNL